MAFDLAFSIKVFSALFAIMNPVANVPVFLSLTHGASDVERRRIAVTALIAVSVGCVAAAVAGVFGVFGMFAAFRFPRCLGWFHAGLQIIVMHDVSIPRQIPVWMLARQPSEGSAAKRRRQ